MTRPRKTKSGPKLPRRVYPKHGAYYFVSSDLIRDPADGKLKRWVKLSRIDAGEPAMLTALAALFTDKRIAEGSMPFACAEYKARKLKKYSDGTRSQYSQYLDVIAADFEDFHCGQVTSKECADFLRNNYADNPNTAQKIRALMKRLFKYIISELGLRTDNPVDQLDTSEYETERREHLPTHEQVALIRAAGMTSKRRKDTGKTQPTVSGPMFCCIIDMTYLCWARAIDVRLLKESQIDGDWLRFKPNKTMRSSGKVVDMFITPQIRTVIDKAREIKKSYGVISPYLFPSRKGDAYTKSGLFSMWDRARDRLGIDKDSPKEERTQFKDLRALGATDAARTGEQKEEIRKRLIHTTTKTSEIYIKDVIPERSQIDSILPWDSV
jgi:hypothetical protein